MLGDSNIDLLKYELLDSIDNFIDTLLTFCYLICSYLQEPLKPLYTLIDNIFSNSTSLEETEASPTIYFLKYFFLKITSSKIQYFKA